jgi:hypothetical protein
MGLRHDFKWGALVILFLATLVPSVWFVASLFSLAGVVMFGGLLFDWFWILPEDTAWRILYGGAAFCARPLPSLRATALQAA